MTVKEMFDNCEDKLIRHGYCLIDKNADINEFIEVLNKSDSLKHLNLTLNDITIKEDRIFQTIILDKYYLTGVQ